MNDKIYVNTVNKLSIEKSAQKIIDNVSNVKEKVQLWHLVNRIVNSDPSKDVIYGHNENNQPYIEDEPQYSERDFLIANEIRTILSTDIELIQYFSSMED